MKYRKLEMVFLAIGLIGIFISILISLVNKAQPSELLGQALFVPVLFLALHYGRQYSYVGAVVAALIYLIANAQDFNGLNLSSQTGQLVIMRAGLFGLIGIMGGELAVRAKYVLARMTSEGLIDDKTNVFSQNYIEALIARMLHEYDRYKRPFSVLFIDLDWSEPLSQAEKERLVPRMANIFRGNVRLVDEVGYWNERFCLVLPYTGGDAAKTIFERLEKIWRHSGHSRIPVTLSASVLSVPEDETEIKKLSSEIVDSRITA
jgi:GGDEF domain-containing protein